MPSRRQIREAAVQFLYCVEVEGSGDPASLRDAFWDFVTESDRRSLMLAVCRMVHHLTLGRDGRLAEFVERHAAADVMLGGWPEAEDLKNGLTRVAELESKWSAAHASLERLGKDAADDSVGENLSKALEVFFRIDRDLVATRSRFLEALEDFPKLRGPLEAVAASVRRLQRFSDRLRMIEDPEAFPDESDLSRIRESKTGLRELRRRSDELVDAVLRIRESIDSKLAEVVEHYELERIDPVDRAILRMAVHEILNQVAPVKVVINEAVELAKRFGTSESGRFVNGVLDRIAKHVELKS